MSSKIPDNVKNPKLYKKNRQWGTYDSGRVPNGKVSLDVVR
jgi:hypothetical protein